MRKLRNAFVLGGATLLIGSGVFAIPIITTSCSETPEWSVQQGFNNLIANDDETEACFVVTQKNVENWVPVTVDDISRTDTKILLDEERGVDGWEVTSDSKKGSLQQSVYVYPANATEGTHTLVFSAAGFKNIEMKVYVSENKDPLVAKHDLAIYGPRSISNTGRFECKAARKLNMDDDVFSWSVSAYETKKANTPIDVNEKITGSGLLTWDERVDINFTFVITCGLLNKQAQWDTFDLNVMVQSEPYEGDNSPHALAGAECSSWSSLINVPEDRCLFYGSFCNFAGNSYTIKKYDWTILNAATQKPIPWITVNELSVSETNINSQMIWDVNIAGYYVIQANLSLTATDNVKYNADFIFYIDVYSWQNAS